MANNIISTLKCSGMMPLYNTTRYNGLNLSLNIQHTIRMGVKKGVCYPVTTIRYSYANDRTKLKPNYLGFFRYWIIATIVKN